MFYSFLPFMICLNIYFFLLVKLLTLQKAFPLSISITAKVKAASALVNSTLWGLGFFLFFVLVVF